MSLAKKLKTEDGSQFPEPESVRAKDSYRVYTKDGALNRFEIVKKTYATMHKNQTVAFVKEMIQEHCQFDKGRLTAAVKELGLDPEVLNPAIA